VSGSLTDGEWTSVIVDGIQHGSDHVVAGAEVLVPPRWMRSGTVTSFVCSCRSLGRFA
jgi:hypothetical protein